jgi:hypothetical protein
MVLVILACQGPPKLAEDMDVSGDPHLAELPADATVIMGGPLGELERSFVGKRLSSLIPPEVAGLPLAQVEEARLGCGSGGCRLWMAGDFSDWSPKIPGVELLAIPTDPQRWLGSRISGWRVQPPRGKAVELAVQEDVVRGGDLEAGGGLAPATLVVPRGDVWFVLRDPLLMRRQAADRLRAEGTVEGAEAAERLDALSPLALGSVRQMAWSIQLEDPRIVGRLETVNPAAALLWEKGTRLQLRAMAKRASNPDLRRMAATAVVRRAGAVVEVEVAP